jgi:hypothetical protein
MARRSVLLISGPELLRLATHICRSERSVRRVYEARTVTHYVLEAVRKGARELGLPPPPMPRASSATA